MTLRVSPKKAYLLVFLFLSLVLVSIYVNSWPMFTGDIGGKVKPVQIPRDYYSVADWLRAQREDFRILIIPMSYGIYVDWAPYAIHDPFYNTPPKPVITGGGIASTGASRLFYHYVYNLITDVKQKVNLGKILGIANVKYILIHKDVDWRYRPEYQSSDILIRSLEQRGFTLINETPSFYILQNNFWQPHMFTFNRSSLVVGNMEFLTSISNLNLSLSDNLFVYTEQVSSINEMRKLYAETDRIIFQNRNMADLIFSLLGSDYVVSLANYDSPSLNPNNYWVNPTVDFSLSDVIKKEFFSRNGFLVTKGNGTDLEVPITVTQNDDYEIWFRVLLAPSGGRIRVSIDGSPIREELNTDLHYFSGFRWEKMTNLHLIAGNHKLTLTNFNGTTYIDKIVIAPTKVISKTRRDTLSILGSNPNKQFIYFEDGYGFRLKNWEIRQNENVTSGLTIVSKDSGAVANKTYQIFAPGKYTVSVTAAIAQGCGLSIGIDETHFQIVPETGSAKTMRPYLLEPTYMNSGQHALTVTSLCQDIEIDQIQIYTSNGVSNTLESLFSFAAPEKATLSYRQNNPTSYDVYISTEGPLHFLFSESYSPIWVARSNGVETEHYIAYTFLNSYYLDKAGEYQINLNYTLQDYKLIGVTISIITFVVLILFLTRYPKLLLNKMRWGLKIKVPLISMKEN